jgi:Fe(3+) dicitrate transport protein
MIRPPFLLPAVILLLLMLPGQAGAQTAAITGLIVTPAGRPVAGAIVTARPVQGSVVTTTTDASGRFAFAGVESGDYAIAARAVGLSPMSRRVTLAAGASLDMTLVLPEVFRERVHVVGDEGLVDRIPGSAHVIDPGEMARVRVATDDIHQMLRQVPGLNLQEEDGYGLRPNIGMRGSGTDRSSKITLMEDGVLIAPAPYAAPAAYYAPTAARMESLEVRKGSSQIKHGPITTGGALNYISTSIPPTMRLTGTMSGGDQAMRRIAASVGSASRNAGWLVETFQFRNEGFKQLDGGGDTGVDISDHLLKFRLNTTPSDTRYQELEVKLGRTSQTGDETYLGLTDADFTATPLRRYAASQQDVLETEHEQYQVRHLVARPRWDLTTVVYRNNFQRAWYKLDSVLGTGLSAVLAAPDDHADGFAVLTGADSAADALTVRNNNRSYYAAGVQTVLGASLTTSQLRHQLEIGLRMHRDEEDRFQQDDAYRMLGGRMLLTRAGAPGSQTNQIAAARAVAGFVTDTISWGRWTASPGVRYERIDFDQTTFTRTDPDRVGASTVVATAVTAIIPGAGVSYASPRGLTLFGGVHKGFAPPGPGAAAGTNVEHSLNYELGTRVRRGRLSAEAVGFFHDYGNLLGRDSLATGGSGNGELFNGGRAQSYGLELSAEYDLAGRMTLPVRVPVRATYGLTRAEFRNNFQSRFAPWGTVAVGDELPYVPRHQLYLSGDVEADEWRARLEAFQVSRMRTRAGQGAFVPAESTEGHVVVNLSGEYEVTPGARLFVSIQNLANSVHIVARHPAGARPGLPRLIQAGLKVSLGK